MASLLSPGILIQERDLTNPRVDLVQRNIGAIAGPFEKGPVNTPTEISSETDLINIFGKPNDSNYEYWYSASAFLSYGGIINVTRVKTNTLKNAVSSGSGVLIENIADYDTNYFGAGNSFEYSARYSGTFGNSLGVAVIDHGADQILNVTDASGIGVGTTITDGTNVGTVFSKLGNAVSIRNVTGTFSAGATLGVGNTISAVSDWYSSQTIGDTGILWSSIAPRPGTSIYGAGKSAVNDELHVVVYDKDGEVSGTANNVLETYRFVSKASDAKLPEGDNNYYPQVIRTKSSYVYWGKHPAAGVNFGTTAQGKTFNIVGNLSYTFSNGANDYSVQESDVELAYSNYLSTESTQIDFLISGPSNSQKASYLLGLASLRKDCIAFVSPPRSAVIGINDTTSITTNIINFFSGLESTSYGVFDSGYKYIYDRFNDVYRYVPCNADVAGLLAQTAINSQPWFSPAGVTRGNIKGAIKLAYSPSQQQRDQLYSERINPITSFPGQGIVLFGDKTALSSPSAFDRINVRRLFLVIEKTVQQAARSQLFEINDEFTRSAFVGVVEPFLRDIQSKRGLYDFLVVCDSTNNPPEVVDNNEFRAAIYLKPARTINYITLTIVATRTGVAFQEVVGTV